MTELQLTSLTAEELQVVADRITTLRKWYNNHSQVPPCQFDGRPQDLSTLTFISYELDDVWSWDEGETLSFAWGNVLAQRFGFEWVRFEADPSPRHFAVRNLDVPYLVFPWFRLYEVFAVAGRAHSAAEDLLVTILAELHSRNRMPAGWHPLVDVLEHRHSKIPEEIVDLVAKLARRESDWVRLLGLSPYDWPPGDDWTMAKLVLTSLIDAGAERRR